MLKNDLLFSHDTVSFIWYMVRMNFTGNFSFIKASLEPFTTIRRQSVGRSDVGLLRRGFSGIDMFQQQLTTIYRLVSSL